MQGWLESVAGPDYASALMWTVVALLALLIILVAIKIVRGLTFGTFVAGGRNRKARLAVMDATAVDSHRRLVLVRRDDVEHLILIGGPSDVVVEQNIRLLPPVRRPAIEDAGDYAIAAASEQRPALSESQVARASQYQPAAPAVPEYQPRAEAPAPQAPVQPQTIDRSFEPPVREQPAREPVARQPQAPAAAPANPVAARPAAPAAAPVSPVSPARPVAPPTAQAPLRPAAPPVHTPAPAAPARPLPATPPRPLTSAADALAPRPSLPAGSPIQRANLVPPRPAAPAPAAPAVAAPIVATPAPAPAPVPAPVAARPAEPAQTPVEPRKQDLDEALFEELEITLEKDTVKSASISDVDRTLDDEMSKLLSEFADKKA